MDTHEKVGVRGREVLVASISGIPFLGHPILGEATLSITVREGRGGTLLAKSLTRVLSLSESSLTVTSIPELSILFFVTRGNFNRICRT